MLEALHKRRSVYALNKELPISEKELIQLIEEVTELVPGAFNMKSAKVIVAIHDQQEALWNTIDEAFEGRIASAKIDGFKAAYGTILYYIDEDVVSGLQELFPLYAENFPIWAQQANGMLQFSIWSALAERNVGANLQHYNPVIDESVKELFNVPDSYKLIAQMPFGGIVERPDSKEVEDIRERVMIKRD